MSDLFETRLDALPFRDQEAREALLQRGAISLDRLLAVVRDRTAPTDVRAAACWAAGQIGDKRTVTALLDAFGDPDPLVIGEAARSLGLLRSKRALRPLLAVLTGDEEGERRWAAAYALGELTDERAVEPLIHALTDPDEDVKVRGRAAESLGYLMDRRAGEPLIAMLRDPSPEVRFWSVFAQGWLRDPRALPELRQLAAEDSAEVPGWWSVGKEAADTIPLVEQGWGSA